MKLISVMISRNQIVFCIDFCNLKCLKLQESVIFLITENITENYLISRNHHRNQIHSKSPCKPLIPFDFPPDLMRYVRTFKNEALMRSSHKLKFERHKYIHSIEQPLLSLDFKYSMI